MNDTISKGVIGVSGTIFGIAISKATLIIALQIISLVVGIAVGVASLVSICFSIRRKYLSWKHEKQINPKDASFNQEETTTT